MKALVYTEPHVLLCRDEPEPTPGNDEVLVRVEAVGICGSDMHAYHGHDSRRPSCSGMRLRASSPAAPIAARALQSIRWSLAVSATGVWRGGRICARRGN